MTDYSMKERTYRYFTGDALYPFGYGLSYSNFKYLSMKIYPMDIYVGDNISMAITFTNTGPFAADEASS